METKSVQEVSEEHRGYSENLFFFANDSGTDKRER